MEEERIKNNWHGLWYYVQRGMYSHQVKSFMDEFSKVKVFLTEDLNKDPQEVVRQACEFLSVDPDYVPPYLNVRFNVSGVPRSTALNNLFLMKNPVQRTVRKIAHRVFTEDGWIAIRDSMHAKLMVKPKMKPETRETLKKVFREDILKLQDMLGMDLSIWLNK